MTVGAIGCSLARREEHDLKSKSLRHQDCSFVACGTFFVYAFLWIGRSISSEAETIMLTRKEQAMYVAIRQYKVKAGSMDDLARRAQEGFVPLIRQSPGFVAYYGVVAGHDRVFTVSIFKDQAGADGSNSLAADWVKQNVAALVE